MTFLHNRFKYNYPKKLILMEDLWICPNCGTTMKRIVIDSGLFHICQKCGCSIEGKEQVFNADKICPNCHCSMESDSECSYCGYDLGSDFE